MTLLPGTIFFTRGEGLVGWNIRHGSGSFFAHCGVVHRDLGGGEYSVVEALWSSDPVQDGTRFRVRRFDDPQWQYKFVWLPDDGQRVALLDASERLGLERPRYDWPELVRIAARGAGVKWRRPAGERRLICSHHVARCVVEAAPEFEEFLPCPVGSVWPGALAAALDAWLWQDDRD